MELHRFVLMENGKVYDLNSFKGVVFSTTTIATENRKERLAYRENSGRAKYMCGGGPILSTSDNIFDLITTDFYVSFGGNLFRVSAVPHKLNGKTYIATAQTGNMEISAVKTIFAPLYRNGEIVSYERVWKKEEGK